MAGLPSVAGTFLSRVCIPFNAPFSKAKVSTTRCQGFAGVALSKSSEKRSSFFLAMDSAGTGDTSAAFAADVSPVPAESIARKKELLFSDDFESATPAKPWHRVVDTFAFEKGALKGMQTRDKNVPATD